MVEGILVGLAAVGGPAIIGGVVLWFVALPRTRAGKLRKFRADLSKYKAAEMTYRGKLIRADFDTRGWVKLFFGPRFHRVPSNLVDQFVVEEMNRRDWCVDSAGEPPAFRGR